ASTHKVRLWNLPATQARKIVVVGPPWLGGGGLYARPQVVATGRAFGVHGVSLAAAHQGKTSPGFGPPGWSRRPARRLPTRPSHDPSLHSTSVSRLQLSRRSVRRTTTVSPTSFPITLRTSALMGSLWVPSPRAINEAWKGWPSTVPRTFTRPLVAKNSVEPGLITQARPR